MKKNLEFQFAVISLQLAGFNLALYPLPTVNCLLQTAHRQLQTIHTLNKMFIITS